MPKFLSLPHYFKSTVDAGHESVRGLSRLVDPTPDMANNQILCCTWLHDGKECGKPAVSYFRLRNTNSNNPMLKVGEVKQHGGYAARCENHSLGIRRSNGWMTVEANEYVVGSVMGS